MNLGSSAIYQWYYQDSKRISFRQVTAVLSFYVFIKTTWWLIRQIFFRALHHNIAGLYKRITIILSMFMEEVCFVGEFFVFFEFVSTYESSSIEKRISICQPSSILECPHLSKSLLWSLVTIDCDIVNRSGYLSLNR